MSKPSHIRNPYSSSHPIKCRPDSLKTITQLPSTSHQLTRMSLLQIALSSFLLATVTCLSVEKAASPYTNIGCQCSSLTFIDSSGLIQGNCKRLSSLLILQTDHAVITPCPQHGHHWCTMVLC